jgi:hypothetical protein
MIFLTMLATCSRCQRQEAVTMHTFAGAGLTATLPTRWRETAGGVVCDRCDHGDAARVIPFPTHLCTRRGCIPPEQRAA